MTHDQAKYLAGIAQSVGVVNWAIGEDRAQQDDPRRFTFTVEGAGNWPHIEERISPLIKPLLTVKRSDDVIRVK